MLPWAVGSDNQRRNETDCYVHVASSLTSRDIWRWIWEKIGGRQRLELYPCTHLDSWYGLRKQQQCWVVASSCELRAPRPTLARLLLQCCVKSFFSQTSIWKRSCRLRKLCVAAETAHGRAAFVSSGAASRIWMRGIFHLQPACQPLANLLESRASTIADEDGDENACSRIF